jgi:Ni,Fe-hydrogenase III small subunit
MAHAGGSRELWRPTTTAAAHHLPPRAGCAVLGPILAGRAVGEPPERRFHEPVNELPSKPMCHANALVLAGPLTKGVQGPVRVAWAGMSAAKFLVLVGACAISGGLLEDAAAVRRSFLDEVGPALYVPGCPPHPLTFIHAILDFIGADHASSRELRHHPATSAASSRGSPCDSGAGHWGCPRGHR